MEYYSLVSPGEKISRIGFGCAALSGYDYGKVDVPESIDAIRKALDVGVNLFDTSDVYGFGQAEEMLAKALGNNRHEAIIATKFGVSWDQAGKTFRDCSPKRISIALEESLRRLQVDCIPIYMIHWHDGVTPLAEVMEALYNYQKEGKIRYVGCSNFSIEMVREASKTHKMDFVQLPYNLVRREYEKQLTESQEDLNTNTMVYDVLARGLFSGKYNAGFQFKENDTRSRDKYFSGTDFITNLQMVERLKVIGRRYDKTPAQVAIRWALEKKHVDSVLVGSKRRTQILENTDVFGWSLAEDDLNELERAE